MLMLNVVLSALLGHTDSCFETVPIYVPHSPATLKKSARVKETHSHSYIHTQKEMAHTHLRLIAGSQQLIEKTAAPFAAVTLCTALIAGGT